MSETINVAVLGLGRIGQQFAAGLSKHIDQGGKPIKIVAVAERDPDSLAAEMFADENVPVYAKASDVVEMADQIDIIFDLTGSPEVRQTLRAKLHDAGNRDTIIVPEIFAHFVWSLLEERVELSRPPKSGNGPKPD
ncbi:MAG: NAD(P)-binding domain-containing protein [Rhodospirillales bacterium]|jgi:homoserine dehydrogenase